MMSFAPALLGVLVQTGKVAPLPAESPIGGPLWSVVIPAVLLVIAFLATLMLYRHFAKRDPDNP